ncbi:MAG: hypothetical protein QOD73_2393 [Solirubrobacteraceae bacterium]|jgi:uncharacterized protein YbcI|nr:hypothetical protein [Solirubrobacteraceae bacterium]
MDPRMKADDVLPLLSSVDELTEAGAGAADPSTGRMRAQIANAMVGLKKEHFGRGPTAAKAWILDDYIFVVMENGLTRNEETLLEAGRADVVRSYRLTFQETVATTSITAVEEITGRKVANYHSQIVFNPTRAFEIFVLEPEA